MTSNINFSVRILFLILIANIFSIKESFNIEKKGEIIRKISGKKIYDDTIIVNNSISTYISNPLIKNEYHIHCKISDEVERGKYIKFSLQIKNLTNTNNYNSIYILMKDYNDTNYPSYKKNSFLTHGYESSLIFETEQIPEDDFYMTIDCYNSSCNFNLNYQIFEDDNIVIDQNENFYIEFNDTFDSELLYCPKNYSEKSLITFTCLQLTDFNIILSYMEINGDIIKNDAKVENVYYNGYSIYLEDSFNYKYKENACFYFKLNYLGNNIQNLSEYIYVNHRNLNKNKNLFFGSYFYSYIKKGLYDKDCFLLSYSRFNEYRLEVLFSFQTKTKNISVLFYNETDQVNKILINDFSETFSYYKEKGYKKMCIITDSEKTQGVLFTVNNYGDTSIYQNLSMPLIRGIKLKSKIKEHNLYLYRVESYRNVYNETKGRLKSNFYVFDGKLRVSYSNCYMPDCNFNEMIESKTYSINNHFFIQFPYDNDTFHKNYIELTFARCDTKGNDGCGFYVNIFTEKSELNSYKDNDIILLNENYKECGVLEKNKEEIYALDIYSERNIYNLDLFINLYIHYGNVDLFVYEDKQLKREIKELNFVGSYKSEYIKIDMSKFKNLIDYVYLKVKSNYESYFFIEYNFLNKNNNNFEYKMRNNEIRLFTTSSYYSNYVFKFNKESSLKSLINVNVLNNCSFSLFYNGTSSREKTINFEMANSLSYLQFIKNDTSKKCLFTLSSSQFEKGILLHSDIPNYNYLTSKFNKAFYIYPIKFTETDRKNILLTFKKFSQKNFILNAEINGASLVVNMNITSDYRIISIRESKLDNVIKKYCTGEGSLCSLEIEISSFYPIKNDEKLYFSIEVNNGIKYPSYFPKNEVYINSFMSNLYNYFLFEINQNEEVEIFINNIKGAFNVLGKIIQKDEAEYEADFRKIIKLPIENDTNLIKYNYYEQKLKISNEQTKNCKNKCYFIIGIYNFEFNLFNIANVYSIYYKTVDKDTKYVNMKESVPVVNIFNFGSSEVQEYYYKIKITKNTKSLAFSLNFDEQLDENMDINANINLESDFSQKNYILNKNNKFVKINGDLYKKTFYIKISNSYKNIKKNSIIKVKYEFKAITFIPINEYTHLIDVYGDHDSSCIFNNTNDRCYYRINIQNYYIDDKLIIFFPNYENLIIYEKNFLEKGITPSYENLPTEENYDSTSKTQLKTNFMEIKIKKKSFKWLYGDDYCIFLLVVNKYTPIKNNQIELIISNTFSSFNKSYILPNKDYFYRVGVDSNIILRPFYDNNNNNYKRDGYTNLFYINIMVFEGKGEIINKENNVDIILDEEQNSNIYFMIKEGNLNLCNIFRSVDFVVYIKIRKNIIENYEYNINYINNFGRSNIYMLEGSKLNNIFYLNTFNVPEINYLLLKEGEQEFFLQIRIQELIPLHEINFESFIVDEDFILRSKYNKELIEKDEYIKYDYVKYDYTLNKLIVHYKINESSFKNNSHVLLSAFYININYRERMKAIEMIPYSFDLYGNFPQNRLLIGVAYNRNNLIILTPSEYKDSLINIEFSLCDYINFNVSINYYTDSKINYNNNDSSIKIQEDLFFGKSILRINNNNHTKLCINIFPKNLKNKNLSSYFMLKYNSKKDYLNNFNITNTSILNIEEINNKSSIKSNFSKLPIKVNSLLPIKERMNPNCFFNYSIHYLIRFFNSSLFKSKEDLNNFFGEYKSGNPTHIKEVIFYYYYRKGGSIITNSTGLDSIIVNLDDITKESYYVSVYSYGYGPYGGEEHFIYEAFNLNLSEPKPEKNDIKEIKKIIFTIAFILGGVSLIIIIITVSIIIYVKKNMPLTSRLDILKQRFTISSRGSNALSNSLQNSNRVSKQ